MVVLACGMCDKAGVEASAKFECAKHKLCKRCASHGTSHGTSHNSHVSFSSLAPYLHDSVAPALERSRPLSCSKIACS